MPHNITIYTDGAASGNPGPGGYGVVLMAGAHRKELSEGFRRTTNNRMELLAVIIGLAALRFEGSNVTIYSDSKYVVDAVEKGWVFGWEKTGFKKKKEPRSLATIPRPLSQASREIHLGKRTCQHPGKRTLRPARRSRLQSPELAD